MAKQPTEISIEVTDLDAAALGMAQSEERGVRIRNALPGELVKARILRRRKGLLYADGVGVENPSTLRQTSVCVYFPRCGGCSMHHMTYPAQLAFKQTQLEQALIQAQVPVMTWQSPVSSGRLAYRRKARLGVRQVGEQVFVGFRESFSNRVARMQACQILSPQLSSLLAPLQELIQQLSIAAQIPQIEMAQGDETCALIVRHLAPFSEADLSLWRQFEVRHDTQILLQSAGYDSIVPLTGELTPLGYQLPWHGLYMQFFAHQFTQVNLVMNQHLIEYALSYLGDLAGKCVLDLFCGIGNFTLPIARAAERVFGVEASVEAVDMAIKNANLNALANKTQFAAADLYAQTPDPQVSNWMTQADALVLDPPRSGAGPQLSDWLTQFKGDEVVYISCNPNSFAADAVKLQTAGFQLASVGIFDMFPHTTHVETMGHFVRTKGVA